MTAQGRDDEVAWADALPDPVRIDPGELAAAATAGRPLVVLDDDPTGTQTVHGVPILTRWRVEDHRWALAQGGSGYFVLTNTRSLPPDAAAARVREIVEACLEAAAAEGVEPAFASRGDSTLRGHFPLETDVVARVLVEHHRPVDAVLLVPAYVDAGRITLHGVHRIVTDDGLLDVGASEFARDATFGYRASRLADWAEEVSDGAIRSGDVVEVPIEVIRDPDRGALERALDETGGGRVVVPDAVDDGDLGALALAVLAAEAAGRRLLLRTGPSFVRARLGQVAAPPIDDAALEGIVTGAGSGLVVIGSHVPTTTRQLERLVERVEVTALELEVARVLDDRTRAGHLDELLAAADAAPRTRPLVLSTTRALTTGADPAASLEIAAAVSGALTEAVGRIVARVRPSYVVAKGGITSADVATTALGIDRAEVAGSLLPGIVSLWRAESGPAAGLPFVVFAGNVGTAESLADVVDRLESACAS